MAFNKIAKSFATNILKMLPKCDIGDRPGISECPKIGRSKEDKTQSFRDFDRPPKVVLYTRKGCHLCDDARQLLLRHGVTPTLVDVDENAELKSCFDTCVPVVEIDGRVRFRGRVEPVLLRRVLRHVGWNG